MGRLDLPDPIRDEDIFPTKPAAPTPGQLTFDGELRALTAQERSFWPPCCDQAMRELPQSCVCALITVCPTHGRRHNGTHD